MLWRSPHPDLDSKSCTKGTGYALTITAVPTDLTLWEWAFESPQHTVVSRADGSEVGSYINALTKERLDFREVKAKAALLSAALVHEYGLQPGDTVSLFSTNTIWYPVAMWATLRAGESCSRIPTVR